ncbi:MAG: type II toxin-antitoxin system RelE/ParE family toxin [Ruminococcaceae bacterium]|nr:type II toxin-antitoxin system RelE/ParE family toxin [Oscillospiraceae bacterium]
MSFLNRLRARLLNRMLNKYKVIVLPEAQQDMREIILYIAYELAAPQAAINLQIALNEAINSLSMMPDRIKIVDEHPWREVGVRRICIKNYYIYFLISEKENLVQIMAVIYSGCDQKNILNYMSKTATDDSQDTEDIIKK